MNKKIDKNQAILNEEIEFDTIRCVDEEGSKRGIISKEEALKIAFNKGLDLVLIAADAKPPVCKIMDYGKYKYKEEKKKKEAKKKQKIIDIKEIKLSVKIAQNDINYKVKHAIEFLNAGKYVKFKVFLKGREISNPKVAKEVLDKILPMLSDISTLEKEPTLEGKYYIMMLIPKKDEK